MKKSLILSLSLLAATALYAADKEVTLTGEGQCAKCGLKKAEECQNTITVEKTGKKTTYYLEKNKASNDFHKNICKASKQVKATGTVKEEDGKQVLTASKIEVVEK